MLTTHFETQILPRIGPTAYGGEVTGAEQSDGALKISSGTQTANMLRRWWNCSDITKATGKGRRDIDDDLEPHDVQTFRQAAGTGLYLSIDRPSLHFAMSVVMSGMSEPKVVHQLQVVRVARYVLQHPGETWLFNYPADPKTLYVYTGTDWAADDLTRKNCIVHCGEVRQSHAQL